MSRTTNNRLRRLEHENPPERKFHVVLGSSNEEVARKKAELMASDEWSPDDDMLVVRFVEPGEVVQ
jgi:hypothetical protein